MYIEKFKNGNANASELWELRNQIKLNSLYTSDYENSYGLNEDGLFYFFEGYFNDLEYLMIELEENYTDDTFFDKLSEYDNPSNLYEYYLSLEDSCLKELFK